mgnify:CR=1 FL=1
MQYGPQIVKNGLVLALDAAEANSYGPIKAEVLVVAGGGGGGSDMGGGGGGGGVIYNSSYTVTRGSTITVTVGNGGAGAVAGVAREALDVGDRAKDVLDLAGNFFLYVSRGSVGVTRGDVELVALIALGEEGERDAVEGDEADDENRREYH